MKNANLKSKALAALLLSALCVPAAQADLEREMGAGVLNWSRGTLRVTGAGAVSGQSTLSAGQQRLMAKRAAQADAYRLLAEAVNGVQVFAETTVQDFVTQSDVIRLQVKAVIRGARRVGTTRYLSDGSVEQDLEMPIFGRDSLAQAVKLGQAIETQFSQPYGSLPQYLSARGHFEWGSAALVGAGLNLAQAVKTAENTGYTGLIIDATGLAAEPALGPFVVGAGARLHPNHKIGVDPNQVVQQGPLHYVEDLDEAREDVQRVGNNPLLVRAKAAVGSPARSNILLDRSTAAEVLEADKQFQFLKDLKVTLVL